MSARPGIAYVAVYLRDPQADAWPLDVGDDPSFDASARFASIGGVLSWGVCRPDLRKRVQPGDLIVFFATDQLRYHRPARYVFVGFATVDRLVSHQAIWEDVDLAVYRQYRNLLIKPSGNATYRHDEPIAHKYWHTNWLWRSTNTRGLRTKDLEPLERLHVWRPGMMVNGHPLAFGPVYILFAPEGAGTFVAADPPLIAEAAAREQPERWADTPLAHDLRRIAIGGSATGRASLRVNNQMAHRHIPLAAPPPDVRRSLETVCEVHGIVARRAF
jgi:hypothetical protein